MIGIEKPSITAADMNGDGSYGKFVLEPLERGFGATIGTLAAGKVVEACGVFDNPAKWAEAWYIFAGYACVVGLLFAIFFKDPQKKAKA